MACGAAESVGKLAAGGDVDASVRDRAGQRVGGAEKGQHVAVGGRVVHRARGADLHDAPGAHHGDAVGEGECLALVVGDQDRRGLQPAQQQGEFELHRLAQVAVQRAERLVQQQHGRLDGERAGDGDALALAAAELRRVALFEAVELQQRHHLGGSGALGGAGLAAGVQAVGDVAGDRQMREHGVLLEHHRDVAAMRRDGVQQRAAQADGAGIRGLEPGDHVQQGRLAAAAGAEQGHDLPVADGQVAAVDGGDAAEIAADAGEFQRRLGQLWTSRV